MPNSPNDDRLTGHNLKQRDALFDSVYGSVRDVEVAGFIIQLTTLRR